MKLSKNLKPASNSMATFYPISTNENSNDFNWNIVTNLFLSELYGLVYDKQTDKLKNNLKIFNQNFEEKFKDLVSDDQAWKTIEEVYFFNNNIAKIAPKLRIFSLSEDIHNLSAEKRIVNLLKTLLKKDYIYQNGINNLNFIEKLIYESFEQMFPSDTPDISGISSYLPNLSNIFSEDLVFLTTNSKYFLDNIQFFIEIYIFLYTAQLAIVINSWRDAKQPEIKDCYFILDTERASRERILLQRSGYKLVEKGLYSIFPILALTELLQTGEKQKVPLWQLITTLTDQDIEPLKKYCQDFADDRALNTDISKLVNLSDLLDEMEHLYKSQFEKGETRASRNMNVVRAIKNIILKPFTQVRGSAGTVFVLNQEYLLLLTNLIIGKRDKIRLYELIKELERRGIFFDKESRKAIVEFYERLGNVEKMSDSGDAIYVKKTI
ncbi:DNA phosphorothioation-dependent restriction protein DptG [Acinetobacter baumannii]|nr:DNA phosphorothioation-dependent restriction protein DptG [Acinetobacter baumannii]MDV7549462.1 DNA phosphorothioation-dependent restriction protein DptG [Acinetobacter baumannii]